ncbi:MAG TPA: ABC transporter substrate-binding protein [Burkholderiales bacterium]|nr:ABC transporter substrate-binding protein [Burkholderiales bacterium]
MSTARTHALAPLPIASALAGVIRQRSSPLTLGMVFPFSNHNFDLRYWLAAAGVHPDRDVRLVAIPPPLMVESLRAGHVDGFCVGEPRNSLAVEEGIGQIVLTKSQIFPRSIEKVLAVRASLESQAPRLRALLQGLAAAAAWADDAANRRELAALLARREYLNVSAGLIEESLDGKLVASGAQPRDPNFLYFHRHEANRPRAEDALWVYAQMVRWGQLRPSADRQRRAAGVFRGDLYSRYVDASDSPAAASALPFDRIEFTAPDIDAYLAQFGICTGFVETSAGLQS